MKNITISKAMPEHIDTVFTLESEYYNDPFSKETLQNFSADPHAIFLCAADGEGSPVGHIVGYISADECEIYTVAVSSAYRGRGIGYELVKNFILTAYDRSVKTIFLEVRQSNYMAASLYEKAGFTNTGVRRFYYDNPTEDALTYMLKL